MGVFLIAILMPVLAQTDQGGDVYEIEPKDHSASYFAYIANPTADLLKVRIYYKPGVAPGFETTEVKSKVSITPVGQSMADREIERRLSADNRKVNGIWVPKKEYELAERARESASKLDAQLALPEPAPAVAGAEADAPPPATGAMAGRGPQIALVVGALVLIGLVVKLLILS